MIKKDQSGVTLALSLLIMAAVSTVAITLSILIINEAGTTKGINNAMKAFYAAESAIEQGTWIVKDVRLAGDTIEQAADRLDETNGQIDNSTWKRQATSVSTDITVNLKQDESIYLDIYNPDPAGSPPGKIKCLYEEHAGPTNLEISWISWSANSGFCPETKKWYPAVCDGIGGNGQDLLPGTAEGCSSTPQRFRVQLRAFDGPATNLTLNVYDTTEQPIKIPSQITIEANGESPTASSRSATQALRAEVQWTLPISGLFSYVIFSDQPIDKTTN